MQRVRQAEGGISVTTAHEIALGILIAIGLLSVIGFVQFLLLPFDIPARILFSAGEAQVRANEYERVCRIRHEAAVKAEMSRRQWQKEAP